MLPQAEVALMRLHQDIDGLCRTLERADIHTAEYAAEFLADIGGPTAVDALLRRLEDPAEHPLLVDAVARCLGQLGERRAVPDLIAVLRRDGSSCEAAARALGDIGDPRAVQPLLDMLDPYTPHWRAVLGALAGIGDANAVPGLLAALWHLLPRADGSRDADLGTEAVRTLGRLGSPRATAALAFLVGTGTMPSELRRAAAEALRQLDVTSAAGYGRLTFAKAALGDPDQRISEAIAEVFSSTPAGLQQLRWSVTNDDPGVRRSVCLGLGAKGDPEDVPALRIRLSEDPVPAVRRAAAHAIARIGGHEAMAALIGALTDGEIHEDVAQALATVQPSPAARLLPLLTDGTNQQRRGAATALGLLGDRRAAPELLDLLTKATTLPVQTAAVEALGRLRHLPATAALIELLTDPETPGRLRARAAWALGRLGTPESEPALRKALGEPIESIRLRAAEALGKLPGSPQAAESLTQAATDRSPDVQAAALQALGNLGATARPALRMLLATAERRLRTDVVSLLARCADTADLDTLTAIAVEDDTQAALHAVDGIARLCDPRTVNALCRIVERPDPETLDDTLTRRVRGAALRGLSRIDDPAAARAVLKYYMSDVGYLSHDAAREAVNTLARRTGTL
ncbi:HEAT repeat domain-containing protein [Streptomyces sp. NBC_00557]|uniref:HEAT repeat domain-containing protein n=1 Tax=Streptomyces sp. NBC_00557 TaxID=2975776 RepID=UPI002E81F3CD|nr:HEAT repeat domain-containing protein [Streptomyces sp. NBC_00557]WUC39279.1 HEAT repeat domain-containing protein [Streptomyces sp. NBC_00557]